ncbi:MAG: class I SAM-dependent methyltransferase [bacterium]
MDPSPTELDAFRCKLCGSRRLRRSHRLRRADGTPFWGGTCSNCGLFQVAYDWGAAPPLRPAVVWEHAMAYSEDDLEPSRRKAARFAQTLAATGPVSGARVLEVGCGRGFLLKALLEGGASHAVGLEYHGGDVTYARGVLGLEDVRTVGFEDQGTWPDAEFDAVVSLDVLEHVHDLRSFFEQLVRVTRPGGIWLHATPGSDAVTHRLGRALIRGGAPAVGQQLCATISYPTQLAEPGPHVQFLGRRQLEWLQTQLPLELLWSRYESAYSFDDGHYARNLPLLRWLPHAVGRGLFGLARRVVRNKLVFAARISGRAPPR